MVFLRPQNNPLTQRSHDKGGVTTANMSKNPMAGYKKLETEVADDDDQTTAAKYGKIYLALEGIARCSKSQLIIYELQKGGWGYSYLAEYYTLHVSCQ